MPVKASDRYEVRFVKKSDRERERDWIVRVVDFVTTLPDASLIGGTGSWVAVAIQRRNGREVARMSVTSLAGQAMYDRVAADLEALSVEEFESEWDIDPAAP